MEGSAVLNGNANAMAGFQNIINGFAVGIAPFGAIQKEHVGAFRLGDPDAGGMVGQELAIQRPDLVRKLVLAVTLSQNNDTVEQVIRRWVRMTEAGRWKSLVRDMAERMYTPAYFQRYRPFLPLLTILQKPRDPKRFLKLAQACLTCDTYDRLDKITCPVLVIGGGQDRVVTAQASEELAEQLGCELVLYEDLGHAAYEEARDFNQRVYDFFAKEEDYV